MEADAAPRRGLLYRCRAGHVWEAHRPGRSYHPCPVMVEGHVCDASSQRFDGELSVAGEYPNITVPGGFMIMWSDVHGDETPRSLGQKGIERANPSQVHTSKSGQGNWREIRRLKKERGLG